MPPPLFFRPVARKLGKFQKERKSGYSRISEQVNLQADADVVLLLKQREPANSDRFIVAKG